MSTKWNHCLGKSNFLRSRANISCSKLHH